MLKDVKKIYATIDEMEDEIHEQMYWVDNYSTEMETLEVKINLLADLKARLLEDA